MTSQPGVYSDTVFSRGRVGSLRSPRYSWPLRIIIGQGIFLIFGWSFFIVTSLKPMPVSDRTAAVLRDSDQAITMIVTFIATVISTVTG